MAEMSAEDMLETLGKWDKEASPGPWHTIGRWVKSPNFHTLGSFQYQGGRHARGPSPSARRREAANACLAALGPDVRALAKTLAKAAKDMRYWARELGAPLILADVEAAEKALAALAQHVRELKEGRDAKHGD